MAWPLLEKIIADKVQQKLGGEMRVIVSGGAALSQPVAELFIGLGFSLLQGYGLTETSPVIGVNQLEHNFPTSVGRPIPGVSVKIAANDENKAQLDRVVQAFNAVLHDIDNDRVIVELSGSSEKIDELIKALTSQNIIETARSGATGMATGDRILTVNNEQN